MNHASAAYRHPVVFFANGLGDTILALPALRALTALFPRRLTLICDEGLHHMLLSELRVRQTIATPMTRNVPDWTREFDVADVFRRIGPCDFFISLVPWHSKSLQCLLERVNAAPSIGFSEQFTIHLPLDFRKHACDLAFDLPKRLSKNLRFEEHSAPLRLQPRSRRVAQRVRKLIPPFYRTLVAHADTGANKMWLPARFADVLDCFLDNHQDFVVLLVGSVQQPLDCGRNSDRIFPCYGLPLGVALALVESADLFLGVDSCMLHAADFFRIPSVGLFGASNPVEFGFRVTPAATICKGQSMESIHRQPVIDALERLVTECTSRRPAS